MLQTFLDCGGVRQRQCGFVLVHAVRTTRVSSQLSHRKKKKGVTLTARSQQAADTANIMILFTRNKSNNGESYLRHKLWEISTKQHNSVLLILLCNFSN